jgi:CDGSH-type Zn-finger protein
VTPRKVVIEEARTVVWCACGTSRNKPFCDGSHAQL